MTDPHVHPDVAAMLDFEARFVGRRPATIGEEMVRRAEALERAAREGHPAREVLERNHPERAGDALALILADHGFDPRGPADPAAAHDPRFEAALDAVLAGDVPGVRERLRQCPELVHARSAYGHRATLLHYLAANAVEIRRQTVHRLAPKVAVVLLEAGADVDATLRAYGDALTTLALLEGSSHPVAAGVATDLRHVLRAAGASS